MYYFRIIVTIFLTYLLFSLSVVSQESTTGNKNINLSTKDSNVDYKFHMVPKGKNKKVFQNAVTEHIVRNKGIQDFYSIPTIETLWLTTILNSEQKWHEKMQKLEQDYRKAFQIRSQLNSGLNDRVIRIGNYSKAIAKIENEIEEIQRQIVQINVDQQVYISGLRQTPINSLVAIKTLYTPDLMSNKKKLDVLNSSIFISMEKPVLSHISSTYGTSMNIPFQAGNIKVKYFI